MTHDEIFKLKTDKKLLDALRKDADQPFNAAELFEQQVSFVYGSVGGSGMTKERVRQVLIEQQGGLTHK